MTTRQLHAAAVLTRLQAAAGSPAMVVHDGKVPDAPDPGSVPPYAVVRFAFRKLTAGESPATTSLTYDSETYRVDVTVYSVGTDSRSTRGVAMRAETQLLNWAPTVANRTCTAMRQIDSTTYAPSESTGPVEQVADIYRFISQPA